LNYINYKQKNMGLNNVIKDYAFYHIQNVNNYHRRF